MAAATTHLPPSAIKAPSAGDSVKTTTQRSDAGQSNATSMDQTPYPDPSPSEPYPPPVATRMAQGATAYDGQASQQLMSENDMNPDYSNEISQSLSHSFVGHNGNELSNGHPGASSVQGHRYAPATTHANGPPATPQQQQMIIVGQHTGMDPNQELSLSSDASRRKRSKVSRACDECRRKKIKCDATLEDGSHQTCNNCKRGQALCTFDRVPQKRGPSKGYIQELSNRVQQIESQAQAQEMRMSQLGALPVALRASLDAGDASRMYTPEGYTSAHDDGESLSLNQGQKRKFSELQDNQPSPTFTQSRFTNNDRMPSLSGWSMSAPQASNTTNQTLRHSVSLAPDQIIDNIDIDHIHPEYEKPFWVQNAFKSSPDEPPPRHFEDINDFPSVHEPLMQLFDSAEVAVSAVFPFLPQAPSVFDKHISTCDNETCYGFATAMKVAVKKAFEGFKGLDSKFVGGYEEFEHHIRANVLPLQFGARPFSVNLVRLWTIIFMILNAEADLTRVRESCDGAVKLTLVELVRIAIRLCTFLLEVTGRFTKPAPDDESDSDGNLVRRAWDCVAVFATWTGIGCGITNVIPQQYCTTFGNFRDKDILGPILFYLSGTCLSLAPIHRQLLSVRGDQPSAMRDSTNTNTHHLHMNYLDAIGMIRPPPPEFEPYLDAATAYFELLVSRSTLFSDANEILRKAILLINTLRSERFMNMNAKYHEVGGCPLFTNHFFNLAVITILELGAASKSPQMSDTCHRMIRLLRRALEKYVESYDENPGVVKLFWAHGLLKLIEATPIVDGKDLGAEEVKKTLLLDFPMLARKGTSECLAEALGV